MKRFVLIIALCLIPQLAMAALTDNLISYWKLDEASGNAVDAHGSNTLTDNATVTTGTGKIAGARDFEGDNAEWLSCADNASLSVSSEQDFTFGGWFKLESKDVRMVLLGKVDAAGTGEYFIDYNPGTDRFRVLIANASTSVLEPADAFGSPSTGTWYYILGWYDATANTANIQINNGTVDSASFADGPSDMTSGFAIGRGGEYADFWFDGLIDEVGFWKRVLTSDERTALYNGGSGLAYPFASGTKVPVFNNYYSR